METKTCRNCQEEKPISAFSLRSKGSKDGHQSYCVSCCKKINKQRNPNKERKEKKGKYHQYNITEKYYLSMYQEQKGRCAICGEHKSVLDVDHDHETGEVRQLLCGKCNRGIGMFHDNPSLLRRAASYLLDSSIYSQTKQILMQDN